MGWLGKVIGGTIGFALGGPLGAIAGAVFGHSFDGQMVPTPGAGRPRLSKNEQTQMVFFVAVFSMLAKMAKADGRICENEYETVEKFIKNELHLNSESRKIALTIFKAAADSQENFESFAYQFYEHFHSQPGFLDFILDVLIRVSASDGTLSDEEEHLLLSAVHIFNYPTEAYLALKAKYIDKGIDYHAILGCTRQDTDAFVKKQYRKLVSEYHPDKIASKGLPDEFVTFASNKFREIQEAYEKVKHERGYI
ncbi:MAG: TerB family tellurite resistance protein [Proteobacteria bacterium]|nr:TerB family tellurite resistance protein [Pseudomonadota bacterium]